MIDKQMDSAWIDRTTNNHTYMIVKNTSIMMDSVDEWRWNCDLSPLYSSSWLINLLSCCTIVRNKVVEIEGLPHVINIQTSQFAIDKDLFRRGHADKGAPVLTESAN